MCRSNFILKSNYNFFLIQSSSLTSYIFKFTCSLIFKTVSFGVLFYREIKDKDEKITALELRLKEAASLATRELVQKAESELKNEKAQREQLESVVANLQLTLQTKEMQYSELVEYL